MVENVIFSSELQLIPAQLYTYYFLP